MIYYMIVCYIFYIGLYLFVNKKKRIIFRVLSFKYIFMKHMKNKGFTLVELIVVITILAILWTISFVSYQWYTKSVRDSVRVSDLSNIHKKLELFKIESWVVPSPESSIDLLSNWKSFWLQWIVWATTFNMLDISDGGNDPLTGELPVYTINKSKTKYQILSYFEEPIAFMVNWVFAEDKTNRFPVTRGDDIGTLLDSETKVSLHEKWENVELNSFVGNIQIVGLDLWKTVVWSWAMIKKELDFRINEHGSCNSILKNGFSKWDGYYTITLENGSEKEVYCDMTDSEWGWTLVNNDIAEISDVNGSSIVLVNNQHEWSNNPQSCGEAKTFNVQYKNVLPEYKKVRMDLERTTTVLQCAWISDSSLKYVGPAISYIYKNWSYQKYLHNRAADRTTWHSTLCAWDSPDWALHANEISEELWQSMKWRTITNYDQETFQFQTQCSNVWDNGNYKVKVWVK